MTPEARQAKILEQVRRQGRVTVEELAALFDASRETIRRDLTALSDSGDLQKIHGGAKLPMPRGEGPFRQRMAENAEAKRAFAIKGAELIAPGDSIFIDTGSTTLIFAEALAVPGLTVITNSAAIADSFASRGTGEAVVLLGGLYDSDNRETHGAVALAQIERYRAKASVLTVGGLHATAGVTDFNGAEAEVARAMVAQSEKVIVLADSSKFNRLGPFAVCSLARIDHLVTDICPAEPLHSALKASKVALAC